MREDGDLHRETRVDVLPPDGMQVLVPLWGRCAGVKMAVRRASAWAGCRAVAGWSGCGGGQGAGRVLVAAR